MKVGYARVSTTDQSLENQISRLAETGCELFFEEKTSGAAKKRPQLEKLLGQLRKDDVVVITRLDRLARSTAEFLRITKVLKEKNAGIQFLDEPWANTTTPAGKMIMTVFGGHSRVRAIPHPIPNSGRQNSCHGAWGRLRSTVKVERGSERRRP